MPRANDTSPKRDPLWKRIPSALDYEINENGEVRNRKTKDRVNWDNSRYPRVSLRVMVDGALKSKSFVVHRAVAQAFIPNPDNLPEARHLDGNPGNPCRDNIAWGSHSQNEQDKRRHGTVLDGERNPQCRLRATQLPIILGRIKAGESKASIARSFGVHRSTISLIASGRKWKHVPR